MLTLIYRKICRLYPHFRSKLYILLNRLHFRLSGARFGTGLKIFDRVYLTMLPGSRLTIGRNFHCLSGNGINPLGRNLRSKIYLAAGAEITIGDDCGVSASSLRAKERITLGNGVNIGADCIIMDTDAHSLDWRVRAGIATGPDGLPVNDGLAAASAPITIGDNVLIGTRCIILKGVTIGPRTIIAAGSIVTRSIPADCIAAGNPARVIKQLTQ